MNITITSEEKDEYLLIESNGFIENKYDLFEHAEMIYAEIIKYDKKKILINQLGTKFPLELFSYLELANTYGDNFPFELRYLKLAIVVSEPFRKIADFWETACVNRGFQFFSFSSVDEAHYWLIQ